MGEEVLKLTVLSKSAFSYCEIFLELKIIRPLGRD